MNPASPEFRKPSTRSQNATRQEKITPFGWIDPSAFLPSAFLSATQRMLSDNILRTSRNMRTLADANRKLLDDMQAIIRRQQDFAFDLTEKLLKDVPGEEGSASQKAKRYRKSFAELFESTSTAMRDLSSVFADAQAATVNNFSEQLHRLSTPMSPENQPSAAAAE